jgi:hypothetical protein
MLDADGDGEPIALTDGVLMLRRLFGFEGDALVMDAVDPQCGRCTADLIESWIDSFLPPP